MGKALSARPLSESEGEALSRAEVSDSLTAVECQDRLWPFTLLPPFVGSSEITHRLSGRRWCRHKCLKYLFFYTRGHVQKVTVEGPVTMLPINHVPWLLGQGDIPLANWLAGMTARKCIHTYIHVYVKQSVFVTQVSRLWVDYSGLKMSGLLFPVTVKKKIKKKISRLLWGRTRSAKLKMPTLQWLLKLPRGSNARSETKKKGWQTGNTAVLKHTPPCCFFCHYDVPSSTIACRQLQLYWEQKNCNKYHTEDWKDFNILPLCWLFTPSRDDAL